MSGFFPEDQDIWSRGMACTRGTTKHMARRWVGVLVYLGCHNKHYRLGGSNRKNLSFTALEDGSLRSGCQHNQTLVSSLFLPYRWLPSCCVLTWWREKPSLLMRAWIPSWGHHPHDIFQTQLSPKGPISEYHHIRASIHDSWRDVI